MNNIGSILRKLAKNHYWQTLYVQSKEINGISLFKNTCDFTDIQINFLIQLSFYNSLYIDIAIGEVGEIVLDNEIYEDAYYVYKNKDKETKVKDIKNNVTQNTKQKNIKKEEVKDSDTWIWRLKKK